ncbi:polymorphic toxin type 50 domain-containing protein [Tepidibacillus sp. LV47]|uniref:polymorphic toxin type 50 domain-containing protein n=1 Tax=Tepidibacillus sp. LV47 TaxID=3398228 RepID=UPI003AAC5375
MDDAPRCWFPPKDDGDDSSGGSGESGGSGGSSGGDTGAGSDPVTPPPPPPPTFEEILEMRSSHFRSLAGIRPLYDVETNVSVLNRYIFHQTKISGYGFDVSSFLSTPKLPKWKKFRLPSSAFKRQVGSMALDFIPVVGNIKSGIEAIIGRDLVTGRKLSVTDRLMAGVGIFTGGGGKALLKGIKFGFKFAKTPKLGISRKGNVGLLKLDLQFFASKGTGKFKIVNGFEAKVHLGKQGKHIPGHPNYQKGKSIFTGDAQKLLDKYAGKGQWIGSNKERVDFKQVIGKWVDPNTGKAYETTKGIIHYSKNGAHIVPARP